jgi:hypothetical protein
MGQVLHGCARTTEAVRRAIQHSQESLRALARRHGVNPKIIANWRARGGDCREFRVWPVMMGKKELPHGPTERAADP